MISRLFDWLLLRRHGECLEEAARRAAEESDAIRDRVHAQWPEVHAHVRVSRNARQKNHFAESIRRALRES